MVKKIHQKVHYLQKTVCLSYQQDKISPLANSVKQNKAKPKPKYHPHMLTFLLDVLVPLCTE